MHLVQRICSSRRHADDSDGVIYTDLRELRETCRSGVIDVNRWRQRAGHDDVMDFDVDLLRFYR